MNMCPTCGLDFKTVEAFDEHRVGTHDYTYSEGLRREPIVEDGRRCLSLNEIKEGGWTQDRSGRWRRPTGEPVLGRVEL